MKIHTKRNKYKHLLPWKIWSVERPKEAGWYFLAGFIPADGDESESSEPEEPTIWELDEEQVSGKSNVTTILGGEEENLLWVGPILFPGFEGKSWDHSPFIG